MALALAFIALAQIEPIRPLMGADETLRRIGIARAKIAARTASQVEDETVQAGEYEFVGGRKRWLAYQKLLEELLQSGPSMNRHEAAQKWLDALDETIHLKQGFFSLSNVIPPTASWPEIQAGIERSFSKRKSPKAGVIRLYGTLLGSDLAAQKAALQRAYRAASTADGAAGVRTRRALADVGIVLATTNGDRELLKQSLIRASLSKERLDITEEHLNLLGPEKEPFLVQLFKQSKAPFGSFYSNQTQNSRLLYRIALQTAPHHAAPQWALAETMDQQRLYEAIAKRFDPFKSWPPNEEAPEDYFPDEYSPDKRGVLARTYYLLSLAKSGRIDQALKGAGDGTTLINKWGLFQDESPNLNTHEFLRRLLRVHPKTPWWKEYEDQALGLGKFIELLETATAALSHKGLKDSHLTPILRAKESALLALDRVPEAISFIRRRADLEAKKEDSSSSDDAIARLEQIAKVLGSRELAEKAKVLAARRGIAQGPDSSESGLAAREARIAEMGFMPWSDSMGGALINIYHLAHRPKDVIKIAEAEGIWAERDMSEVDPNPFFVGASDQRLPTSVQLGMALVKVGRAQEAYPLAKHYVSLNLANDSAYEFLLRCGNPNLLADLDAFAALNPYEERPLIWKAKKLLQQDDLKGAEATIREAIAIDPSDGQARKGSRMLAYSVLAEILERKGDSSEASLYRKAVKAVRRAEAADDLLNAGLISRAIKEYDLALADFADAYCIQSRLAVNLAKAGRMPEAAAHYRRAYELMADSFGFVETHCFGCEEAFSGDIQQKIAEEVFTQDVKNRPTKPQVHYLLGYLRYIQDRPEEAIPHFRRAVELDARYLNAWKRLAEAGKNIIPKAELDLIEEKIKELDREEAPNNSRRFLMIRDSRSFIEACQIVERLEPPPLPSLFKLKQAAGSLLGLREGILITKIDDSAPITPGQALIRTRLYMMLSPSID